MSLLVFSALGCQHSPSRISVDALRVFSFGNLSKLSHCKCHFFGWKHLSNVAMFRTLSHEAVFILATGFWNLRQLLETQKLLRWTCKFHNGWQKCLKTWTVKPTFPFHVFPLQCQMSLRIIKSHGNSEIRKLAGFFFGGGNFRLLKNPSTLDSSILSCRSAGVTMRK